MQEDFLGTTFAMWLNHLFSAVQNAIGTEDYTRISCLPTLGHFLHVPPECLYAQTSFYLYIIFFLPNTVWLHKRLCLCFPSLVPLGESSLEHEVCPWSFLEGLPSFSPPFPPHSCLRVLGRQGQGQSPSSPVTHLRP